MQGMPADSARFLKAHEDYIVSLGPVPDSWRTPAEPFLKILEDPNHGWFQEQAFALMKNPPRSRYEFVLALYEEYKKSKVGMRRFRAADGKGESTKFIELEIATNIGYLGHYTGDSAKFSALGDSRLPKIRGPASGPDPVPACVHCAGRSTWGDARGCGIGARRQGAGSLRA